MRLKCNNAFGDLNFVSSKILTLTIAMKKRMTVPACQLFGSFNEKSKYRKERLFFQ